MKRLLPSVLLLSLVSVALADEAADNGAKYLAQVSEAWAKGLPEDFTLGMYVGRKWIGQAVFTVKAAPADSGAAYEMTLSTEITFGGSKMTEVSRSLLAKDLSVVSAESTEDNPEGKTVKRLTTKDGKWSLHTEKGEEKTDTTGELAPNATWDGTAFLAYARPEATPLAILSLSSDGEKKVVTAGGEKQVLWLDGVEGKYDVLTIQGKDRTSRWFTTADGGAAAMVIEGAPFMARPCKAAEVGKDLVELPLPPCGRTVTSLYLAIKKGEGDVAAACFDIQTMAKDAGQPPADFEKDLVGSMMTEQTQANLPAAEVLEDMYAGQLTCSQEGDEATVKLGTLTFKLHKTTDAAGEEAWLIYAVEQ